MSDDDLIQRLKQENELLRAALRPFAEWSNRITHQDIERAKALMGVHVTEQQAA